jgi:hypothetical protein
VTPTRVVGDAVTFQLWWHMAGGRMQGDRMSLEFSDAFPRPDEMVRAMATSPVGTIELLARRANSSATGDDAVKWAIDALVDGFDSPSLRQLAGLNAP